MPTLAQRRAAAELFVHELSWPFAVYVDGMADAFERTFAAWPLRFFLVDADGVTLAHVAQPTSGYTYSVADLRAAVEPLLTTVRALLAPGGVAVFGHRARNGAHEACLAAAASHGLRWTEIAWRPWEGEGAAGQEAGWGCPLEILHLGKMERAED